MKNPQTTIAPTFLTHIISAIDGVYYTEHTASNSRDLFFLRKGDPKPPTYPCKE